MATVLLTGFEPFAAATVNPSWEAARAVAAQWTGADSLLAVQLPVDFAASALELKRALDQHRPALVISLGVAEGRNAITPERVAINVADARIPDNAGAQPVDMPCVEGAPDGLMSTLPVKAIVRAIRAAGIASSLSQTAGTYVCNHVFFHLQHALLGTGARGGFIHVPATPQTRGQATGAVMEQGLITTAVHIAVETALEHSADVSVSEGALH